METRLTVSTRNHRAIVFHDLDDVPPQSSGYVTASQNRSFTAAKDEHGVWFDDHGRILDPPKTWIFTSHSGPANDAAFRELVRDELRSEQLGLSPDQANAVLSALWEKVTDVERYLSGYTDVKNGPNAADECCDFHRMRFQARVEQRAALKRQRKELQRLIMVFEGIARLESVETPERGLHA